MGAGTNYGLDFVVRGGDYVIAADGGLAYLQEACIEADLVIGDFDSLNGNPDAKNVVHLSPDKDDTDTLAALRAGLAKGYENFFIYCGTGGRIEHTLANIQCLAFLAKNGKKGWLVDGDAVMSVIAKSISFDENRRGYVSVFAYSDTACKVSIQGLKYEARNQELSSDFPIGVSNEFVGKPSRIDVESGLLLLVFPR